MSAEEVLITHDGYTDTSYASCGDVHCTEVILRSIGVPDSVLEARGIDLSDEEIGDDTQITVTSLGESDSCEWCATCGTFVRHGIVYPGEDAGCHHANEAGEVDDTDPPAQPGPHIDLRDAIPMKEYWGTIFNT